MLLESTQFPFTQIAWHDAMLPASSRAMAAFVWLSIVLIDWIELCNMASGAAAPLKLSCTVSCELMIWRLCALSAAVSDAKFATEAAAAMEFAFESMEMLLAVTALLLAVICEMTLRMSAVESGSPIERCQCVE